jgi:hypothetical protein
MRLALSMHRTLQVNGYRLLGINHMEVVSVLKELPIHVRMVCGRNIASQDPLCPIDTAQHEAAFQTRVRKAYFKSEYFKSEFFKPR